MEILKESVHEIMADAVGEVHREQKMKAARQVEQPSMSRAPALAPGPVPRHNFSSCARRLELTAVARRHLGKCMGRSQAWNVTEPARIKKADDLDRILEGGRMHSPPDTDSADTDLSSGEGEEAEERAKRNRLEPRLGRSTSTQQEALECSSSSNQPSNPAATEPSSAERPARKWTFSTATALHERAGANGEGRHLRRWRLRLSSDAASSLAQPPVTTPGEPAERPKAYPPPPAEPEWEYDSMGFRNPVQKWAHEM